LHKLFKKTTLSQLMSFEFKSSPLLYVLFGITLVLSLSSVYVSYTVYMHTLRPISGYSSEQATISLSVEGSAGAGGVTGGTGGGGGGGQVTGALSFQTSEDTFNLKIVSGESETNEVIIENTGSVPMTIKVSVIGVEQYISFNSDTISLSAGERFPLTFTTHAPEPGVYAGKIILTYQGVIREVLVLINVVSEGVLFDATVTIPDLYRVIGIGQRLPVLIELTEVGAETGVDVTMDYIIKDFEGNTHYTESETFYVLGTKSFSKRFSTAGLNPGDYVLGVELKYPGGFATSSAHFKISESVITIQTWVALGVLFVAIMAVIISIIFYRKRQTQQVIFKKMGSKKKA